MADIDTFGPCADGNFIEFFTKDKRLDNESLKQGRPIFVCEDWVKIGSPGDLKTRPEFQMSEVYVERYKKEYEAWKRRLSGEDSAGVIGTPLTQWPQIDRALAVSLRAQGVHNVEMLAGITDANIHNFGPGIRQLRSQAQAFLEAAKGHAPIAKLTLENEQLKQQLDAVSQQLSVIAALVKEKGLDVDAIKVEGETGAAPARLAAPAVPSVDLQSMIAAAVAAAVGNQQKPQRGGWKKGKKRGRPFSKKVNVDVAEASEDLQAA